MERIGMEIENNALNYVKNNHEVIIFPPTVPIKARHIRADIIKGKDVRNFMPDYVWKVIEPHTDLFQN